MKNVKKVFFVLTAFVMFAIPCNLVAGKERKVKTNECIKLAEEKPDRRAYGEGVNGRESSAKAQAELQARAALARSISVSIKNAIKESDTQRSIRAYTEKEGVSATEEESSFDEKTIQIAEEVVQNAPVIKTIRFTQANGQYHVYVCVELKGSPLELSTTISNKVKRLISDDAFLKKFEENLVKGFSK